ncbi:MAG: SH3 domain-containing protein [Clostridia bacterium]|nr:SH3 domain-containing protein [Clostridia bacterium]
MERMRRILAAGILGVLLLIMNVALAENIYIVSENGKSVNVRKGPGRGYTVVTSVNYGTRVERLGEENGWVHVKVGDIEGYVMERYTAKNAPAATSTSKPTDPPLRRAAWIVSDNGGNVYLRAQATRQSAALKSLPNGTAVTVLYEKNQWSEVTISGTTGYVMNRYLSYEKPMETPAPAATKAPGEKRYVVSANGRSVRVRQAPSIGSKVIASLNVGTQVVTGAQNGRWTAITFDGKSGWIMTQFLSTTQPVITSVPTATPVPATRGVAYVVSGNGKEVRVREKAVAYSRVLGNLPVGTKVTTLETSGSFTHIQVGNLDGYMMTRYLSRTEAPQAPTASPTPQATAVAGKTCYVVSGNGKSVNLRSGAGRTFPVVDAAKPGVAVKVVGTQGSWSRLEWKNGTVYIMSQYLSDRPPEATATAAPASVTPTVPSANKWVPAVGSRVYIGGTSYQVRTRRGPGMDTSTMALYVAGTPAVVRSVEGDWVQVRVSSDDACYVPLTSVSSSAAASLPQSSGRAVVYLRSSSESAVTVRAFRQEDSQEIGSYINGTAVVLISQNQEENWAYVRVGGQYGYINYNQFSRRN